MFRGQGDFTLSSPSMFCLFLGEHTEVWLPRHLASSLLVVLRAAGNTVVILVTCLYLHLAPINRYNINLVLDIIMGERSCFATFPYIYVDMSLTT